MIECRSCRFYVVDGSPGACRRHAPVIVFRGDSPHLADLSGVWPLVEPSDGCGDGEPIPD